MFISFAIGRDSSRTEICY